jgi:regulator of protease activity HflC (stomatin/prohibitin superfamily)
MHTTDRTPIQELIATDMNQFLNPRGFIVQSVLLENIVLPAGLSSAIAQKMQAEQEAQQMTFTLQSAEKEAQRKAIEAGGVRDAMISRAQGTRDAMRTEAEGTRDAIRLTAEGNRDKIRMEAEGSRDAQLLVVKTLNAEILYYLGIDAAQTLCKSPNTKVIITDGGNPVQIGN